MVYYITTLLVYGGVDAIACLGLSQQFGIAGVTNFGFIIFQAADDHRGEEHDGLGVAPRLRVPEVDESDEDPAGEPGDRAADHQRGRAQRAQVLAERVGDRVVVAHRAQRAAVRGLGDARHEEVGERREQHRDRGVPPLVALRQRVDRAL